MALRVGSLFAMAMAMAMPTSLNDANPNTKALFGQGVVYNHKSKETKVLDSNI